ncbi:MAG: hypothetical protein Q7S73_02965 [bacterium]|nr:hypothetical protein [bacterium]
MKKLFILLLLIIITGAAWFIFKDFQLTNQPKTNAPSELINPVSSEVQNQTSAIPDLNRSIAVSADLSADSKKKSIEVIKNVSEQLKKNPDVLDGWLILGLYRREIGDAEGAAEAWKYLTTIRPKDARAFSNLAGLYSHELKDYPKAEEWYNQGIKADSNAVYLYFSLAEFYQYFTKEIEKVDDVFLLGLKNNPGDLSLISQLAYFYKSIGEKEKALDYFKKLVALDPSNDKAKQELENLR